MQPKEITEHQNLAFSKLFEEKPDIPQLSSIYFKESDRACLRVSMEKGEIYLSSSYFIGLDWLDQKQEYPLMVSSKINRTEENEVGRQVNILYMLQEALAYPEVYDYLPSLMHIQFDKKPIRIDATMDVLTPMLIAQFLHVVKQIVKRGLKNSYYHVESNLNSRIKGKILQAQNLKQNLLKNRPLHTVCRYSVFEQNGIENRLIKKALLFVNKYLSGKGFIETKDKEALKTTLNFIRPAFEAVSSTVQTYEIKNIKLNPFYKDYKIAIELAILILKRYAFNIEEVNEEKKVKCPPFWIDMSLLFEFYVYSILKKCPVGSKISPKERTYGNELDYLLKDGENSMVIDAKYKQKYNDSKDHLDIRQVVGYSRLTSIRKRADYNSSDRMMDCLIIYPDQETGQDNLERVNREKLTNDKIEKYEKVYKLGVKLPISI
ncbi:5-methylcytosine restriction system specificity protein McrC [Peijinzhouia sedimentorum]